ncbi:MAG: hypothetical protein CVU57_03955 [Deltaproteobacteria bacterium HGW-Deltaproteobacteria-15]|nr:MAG: hypothetical protein CVU57_03955 [Deltaproteobacteria bacterium HGW-Deltaproteobacteria-15]
MGFTLLNPSYKLKDERRTSNIERPTSNENFKRIIQVSQSVRRMGCEAHRFGEGANRKYHGFRVAQPILQTATLPQRHKATKEGLRFLCVLVPWWRFFFSLDIGHFAFSLTCACRLLKNVQMQGARRPDE